MADGFSTPNPADSGDDEEDDPWASVADEDELKRRAQSDLDADSGTEDDTADDSSALQAFADAGDDDAGGDDTDPLRERANDLIREASVAVRKYPDLPEADRVRTVRDNADDHIGSLGEMDDERRQSYDNLLDLLESATDDLRAAGEADDSPEEPESPPPKPEDADERVVPDLSGDVELVPSSVSCADCAHRNVCVILSSFAPKLADENWDAGLDEEGSPVDPMDFAKICDSYAPEDDEDAPSQTVDQ